MRYNYLRISSALLTALVVSTAQAGDDSLDKLAALSFTDLGSIVTSVSKRPEEAFTAPAAVYVITHDDIKNSGLQSIPEILRMAPGLQVTQSDAGTWAITSRGFNADGWGNKLLVLIDGRSVYTPIFSGVYWDAQDTFIDDIDRIEIIRGPGATLWGANAVNGVINIITKSAKDTQTNVVNAEIGTRSRDLEEARHGGTDNDGLYYRVYGKHFDYAASETTSGTNGGNNGWSDRGGFRIDWQKSQNNDFTFQGDVYNNNENLNLLLPDGSVRNDIWAVSGGNILSRWNHKYNDDAKSSLQIYLDHATADYSPAHENINTFDMDYQYDKNINDRNDIVTGMGYRYIWDNLVGSQYIGFTPTQLGRSLYSTFIQDTYKIVPDKLHLTLGSKLEHNDYTGFEYEPSARIGWYPNSNNTVWASVSRAVRTPSRAEDDVSFAIEPGYVRLLGNPDLRSEVLVAYELGYRIKPTENLLFDATTFINKYSSLRTLEQTFQNLPADTAVGLQAGNNANATSQGFELASTWSVTKSWKLKGSYTFLTTEVATTPDSTDTTSVGQSGMSPRNQFNIASQLFLSHSVELDNNLYYVENLPTLAIPGYYRFDSRIMWTVKTGVELSLVGQNLLKAEHQEFTPVPYSAQNEIGRNVYAKVTVRF